MVSEPSQVRAYPSELSLTFCFIQYRAADGPPTHFLSHAQNEYTSGANLILRVYIYIYIYIYIYNKKNIKLRNEKKFGR